MSVELVSSYEEKRPDYKAFTKAIAELLRRLLEYSGIEVVSIEQRTKDIESFRRKVSIDDKADKYAELEDITDLSGLRVTVYLQEDCERVVSLIKDEFSVDWDNSVTRAQMDGDRFGYLSDHYVVRLSDVRSGLRELSAFVGMKAEIQVRTVLQSACAAVDHKLGYKSEREVPDEFRRRLFRISTLLETADDEFSYLATKAADLRTQYSKSIEKGHLKIPINAESIAQFVETSPLIEELREIPAISRVMHPNMPTVDPVMKIAEELRLNTIQDLSSLVEIGIPELRDKSEKLCASYEKHHARPGILTLVRIAAILGAGGVDRAKLLNMGQRPSIYLPLVEGG